MEFASQTISPLSTISRYVSEGLVMAHHNAVCFQCTCPTGPPADDLASRQMRTLSSGWRQVRPILVKLLTAFLREKLLMDKEIVTEAELLDTAVEHIHKCSVGRRRADMAHRTIAELPQGAKRSAAGYGVSVRGLCSVWSAPLQ